MDSISHPTLTPPPAGELTLQVVERALNLPDLDAQQAQLQMAPRPRSFYRPPARAGSPHQGGVLLLLYPNSDQLTFTLTRRTETLGNHRGQISLPGGRQEAGERLADTALREANEELGLHLEPSQLLGRLASLYIPPSDFEIHPFVAYLSYRPHLVPAPAEVAELIEVPLSQLLNPAVFREEEWIIRNLSVDVPYYLLVGQQVWGATAMVLSEMEQRLRRVMGLPLEQQGSDQVC